MPIGGEHLLTADCNHLEHLGSAASPTQQALSPILDRLSQSRMTNQTPSVTCFFEQTNAAKEPDGEDEQVCCEALEVMTLCFALMPTALDTLSKEKAWQTFIIDLLLHCHSKYVKQGPMVLVTRMARVAEVSGGMKTSWIPCVCRSVRQMAQEQFFLMATRCCMGHRPLLFFITLLFTVLGVSAATPLLFCSVLIVSV